MHKLFLAIALFGSLITLGQEVKIGIPLGHTHSIDAMTFPHPEVMVTLSEKGNASVWHLEFGKELSRHTEIMSVNSGKHSQILPITGTNLSLLLFNTPGYWIFIQNSQAETILEKLRQDEVIVLHNNTRSFSIWDLQKDSLIASIEGTRDLSFIEPTAIGAGSLHLDDGLIALKKQDGTYVVKSVKESNSSVRDVPFSDEKFDHIQFIGDGTQLLCVTKEKFVDKIKVWDIDKATFIFSKTEVSEHGRQLHYNNRLGSILSIIPDNKNALQAWDIETGNTLFIQTVKGDAIRNYYDPAHELFFTASTDSATIYTINRDGMSPLHRISLDTLNEIEQVKVSSQGTLANIWTSDYIDNSFINTCYIWDIHSGKLLNKINIGEGIPVQVEFGPDNDKLYVRDRDDNWITAYSIVDGSKTEVGKFKEPQYWEDNGLPYFVSSQVFNQDSSLLVRDGVRLCSWNPDFIPSEEDELEYWFEEGGVWYVEGETLSGLVDYIRHLEGYEIGKEPAAIAVFTSDGKRIATGFEDGKIVIWDPNTGKVQLTLNGHTDVVEYVAFAKNDEYLISTSEDQSAILWDASDGQLLIRMDGHGGTVTSATLSNDESIIRTRSENSRTSLWDTQSGRLLISKYQIFDDASYWLHLHPSGLFDASHEAMEMMYWTKGLEVIEFEQLKDRYWLPGLWEKVMKGEEIPAYQKNNKINNH